jgi:pSer/pThr/pTyr-binding forkhead associated (FHA) protein
MAKLVLSCGGSVLDNHFIEKSRVAIGRAATNDLVVDDPQVAATHAAIITVGEDQILEGLDAELGTFVNGKRITRHILQHRDVIELGAFSLRYLNSRAAKDSDLDRTMIIAALPRQAAADSPAAAPGERAMTALRQANVRFPSGRLRRLFSASMPPVVELDRVVTMIGIVGITRAVVTRRPHGFFLTHVEGARRTRLNGAPIGEGARPLRTGDVIEAAGQQVEFVIDTATDEEKTQPAAMVPAELPAALATDAAAGAAAASATQ